MKPVYINSVEVAGVVHKDPESRFDETGKQFCQIALKTEYSVTDQHGEVTIEIHWQRVKLVGRAADEGHRELVTGANAIFWGRNTTKKYEVEGITTVVQEVICDRYQLISLPLTETLTGVVEPAKVVRVNSASFMDESAKLETA